MTKQQGQGHQQGGQQGQPQSQGQQGQGQGQVSPQDLQAAAQLGQGLQRAGLSIGSIFTIVTMLRKHLPAITALIEDLRGALGSANAPESQAQTGGQGQQQQPTP